MFLAEQAPDDGHVLDADVDRDGAESTTYAQREAQQTEAVEREGLDDTKHIHVDVDCSNERTQEIHEWRTRDGTDGSQHNVGRG